MYSIVKNNAQRRPGHDGEIEGMEPNGKETKNTDIEDISLLERALSLLSAMVSGLFYGTMWLPVNYIMAHPDNFPGIPKEPLPYIFPFCCGVLCTAIVVFLVYAISRRNHPWVSAESAIPAFSTGVVFACGMTAFVVAIDKLDASIAYPICQMAPGLVVSSWSVLYYREISMAAGLVSLWSVLLHGNIGILKKMMSENTRTILKDGRLMATYNTYGDRKEENVAEL